MESLFTTIIFIVLVGVIAIPYWRRFARQRDAARRIHEKNQKAGMLNPVTLHPKIEITTCIGCASCVKVCPEGVLGIVDGHAAIVSGMKCIGHAMCADVCPVGAITMGFGTPRQGMEIPEYDENLESNVPGVYIVGELGGMGLIKNAVAQGLRAIDHFAAKNQRGPAHGYDVAIVGAGPAGMTAALSCQARGLRYVVLEQDEVGGTILHYPRQKIVLTAPVELPLYGKLKVSEISKEELLDVWKSIVWQYKLNIKTQHKVESIDQVADGFVINARGESFHAGAVVLALGRRGSPRKLGVPGEDQAKVMYRLIEAETYTKKHILVVGGGDSAVEAAVGLARQPGNIVTISYRREDFVRLKEKNEQHIQECIGSGKVKVIFNSHVLEIKPEKVLVQEGKITHSLVNDALFVFAGGELPAELLKRTGVDLRPSDVEVKAA